jgi:glucuronokinase
LIIEERAYARAGLLGNPSDGYFGKTISISVKNFGARISLYESPELRIELNPVDQMEYPNIHTFMERIKSLGYYGGERLVKAAIKKFTEYCRENHIQLENKNFTIRYLSTIPRQVGLAGSSAIITATFRALMRFFNIKISKQILPTLILNAEMEELGINAGLQDRVIQVYEGCVFMDFDKEHLLANNHGIYKQMDPNALTNLFIAYKTELSKVSGVVFNDVRSRYDQGDQQVIDILSQIAECAEEGRKMIENADISHIDELINKNFDLRQNVMNISESNLELVQTARNCGASAKFAGSGGSIIGRYKDDEMLTRLIVELKKIKARVIKPYIL